MTPLLNSCRSGGGAFQEAAGNRFYSFSAVSTIHRAPPLPTHVLAPPARSDQGMGKRRLSMGGTDAVLAQLRRTFLSTPSSSTSSSSSRSTHARAFATGALDHGLDRQHVAPRAKKLQQELHGLELQPEREQTGQRKSKSSSRQHQLRHPGGHFLNYTQQQHNCSRRYFGTSAGGSDETTAGNTTEGGKPKPPVTDYYSLLGLPRKYLLTSTELDQAFRETQKRLHPDKIAHLAKDAAEKARLEDQSSLANEAARVLRSPLERAKYWLELHEVPTLKESQRIQDPALLAEMMDLYEELDDNAADAEIVARMKQDNDQAIAAVVSTIDRLIQASDFVAVQNQMEKLSLLNRLAEKLRAVEDAAERNGEAEER
ncbi:unnamed protein product [Amoebophrya sp. A120]|nr:unnamed protein product [Amoebophrya sp. A120]|eukprot:GSA120T00001460001.1